MPRRPLFFVLLLVVGSLVLAACLPAAQAPPPGGGGGGGGGSAAGLPSAPGGAAAGQVQSDTNPDPAVGADSWTVADAPDPFVLRVDPAYCAPDNGGVPPGACYYAYTTMVFFNPVPVWRSSDLVHWHMAGAYDGGDSDPYPDGTAVNPNTFSSWSEYFGRWAPSVMQIGGQYVMWYSAQRKGGAHCLGVATAASPDGPFNDAKGPYCRDGEGGVIDPSPFVDSNGKRYLTYKTEVGGGRLYAAELSSDGKTLLREGLLLTNAGGWESPRIEGPTLWRSSSGLFLFYSAGAWENGSYVVGAARCDGPLGPCARVYTTPVLPSRGSAAGPGGQTPFVDAGGTLRLVFHAWRSGDVGYPGGERSLRFLPVSWPGGNPKVG
jgi:beta-xylosidase